MFGRKKNNFYRYMFQKSFMPLFAMLVVISMAFLIFFRITVVREKQKNRENDQRRLETCVSFTELQMKEIEKWGKQLLNGVELQKFVYMYDDLGRYSRFSLQNEIYEWEVFIIILQEMQMMKSICQKRQNMQKIMPESRNTVFAIIYMQKLPSQMNVLLMCMCRG